jgi:hypothetical protein
MRGGCQGWRAFPGLHFDRLPRGGHSIAEYVCQEQYFGTKRIGLEYCCSNSGKTSTLLCGHKAADRPFVEGMAKGRAGCLLAFFDVVVVCPT